MPATLVRGQTASAPIIASISNSQSITEGQNVTLSVSVNGTAPFTYQWRKDGAAISGATGSTLAFAPIRAADAGTYTVVVANSVGNVTSGPVILAVNPAVAPRLYYQPSAVTYTIGDTLSLSVSVSGTSPMTFEWKHAGVLVATTTSSYYSKADVQTADAGTYTVTVTNVAGSVSSNPFTVTVNPVTAPVISYGPYGRTLASGDHLSLYVGVSGRGPFTYQWRKDGTVISGATSSSYSKSPVTTADSGSYTVTVTNSAGSTTSPAATVTVNPPVAPHIYSVTEAVTVAVGDTFSLSVSTSGTEPLSYQWRKDGQAIAGATSSYFSKTNAQSTDAGSYSVIVSNAQGSAVSNGVPVTVTSAQPPVITYHPPSRAIPPGGYLSLSVSAIGTGPFSYQWKKDGVAVPGATGSSYYVTSNATAAVAGIYTVTVSSTQGAVTSEPCTVTMLAATPPVVRTQPASQTVRQGQTFEIYGNGSGIPSPTYQWRKDGVAIAGATASNYYKSNVSSSDAGAYSFVVTNSAGSATSESAAVTVVAAATPQIVRHPSSASLLPGEYYYGLEVGVNNSSGTTVQWYRDGQAISGANYYYYSISNAQPSVAGTYHAVVTSAGGTLTSREAVITVDANTTRPVITYVSGGMAVHGGHWASLTIATSGTGESVQWFRNGTAISGATGKDYGISSFSTSHVGTYTAQVTTTAGTFTSRPIELELLNSGQPPAITRQPAGGAANVGESVSFFVDAEGEIPFTYQWRKDGANIPGATGYSYYLGGATAAHAGAYTVVVSNRNGSATSAGATLTVATSASTAPLIRLHPASQVVTSGYSYLSLNVELVDGTGATYQWRKDGVNLPGATGSSYGVGLVSATAAGRYSVVVTNAAGSATSNEAMVTVINRVTGPTFTLQPQNQGAFTGTRVTFTTTATGSGTILYQWRKNGIDIPGATSATYSITSVQLADAGSYSVLATDTNGSASSASATLSVQTGGVAPAISGSPLAQTVVVGTRVTFTGTASGTPPPIIQWLRNGTPIPGATSATLTIASAQVSDAGAYSFTATNAFGTATSNSAPLTVTVPAPAIETQPAATIVAAGANVDIWVLATGSALTYQWRKDGAIIPGATSSLLTLTNVQAASGGRYSVVVSNSYGSATSTDAVLTVVTVTAPPSRNAAVGENVVLAANVQSTAPLTFGWLRNGVAIPSATSSVLSLNNVQVADAGTYTLLVTSSTGQVLYPSVGPAALTTTLTVVAKPQPVFTQHPIGGSVPIGGTFTLTVAASGDSFSYQWQKNGLPIPDEFGPTLALRNAQPSDAGDYRAVLLTANGPVYSNVARVEVTGSAFAGTYFGTFATGDHWALHVMPDGTAQFIAILWTRGQVIVAHAFTVSSSGQFSFGGTRAAGAEGGAEAEGASPLSPRHFTGEVSGAIGSGVVSGGLAGFNMPFSGQRNAQEIGAPAGFYQAVPLAADFGEIAAIVGGDGQVLLLAVDAAGVRGGFGRVESDGTFNVTQPGSYSYSGRVTSDTHALQGMYVPASGGAQQFAPLLPPTAADRLINVATRGLTGPGPRVLTAGFVVGGQGTKDVLIRAVGPGLAGFGVSGTLPNPKLRLFRGGTPIMENDDWGLGGFTTQIADASARLGAFGLQTGSADAALIARLEPGQYSAQISGDGDSNGVALVEVYDAGATTDGLPRLINLSTRGEVGRGGDILIVGVVVSGTVPKKLLIRGIGPALSAFGVPGALADPRLQLYQGQTLIRANDNWSDSADAGTLAAAAVTVGGFALPPGSKDAALLLYLAPGNYTAQVSGVNDTTGVALVEAYEVP